MVCVGTGVQRLHSMSESVDGVPTVRLEDDATGDAELLDPVRRNLRGGHLESPPFFLGHHPTPHHPGLAVLQDQERCHLVLALPAAEGTLKLIEKSGSMTKGATSAVKSFSTGLSVAATFLDCFNGDASGCLIGGIGAAAALGGVTALGGVPIGAALGIATFVLDNAPYIWESG